MIDNVFVHTYRSFSVNIFENISTDPNKLPDRLRCCRELYFTAYVKLCAVCRRRPRCVIDSITMECTTDVRCRRLFEQFRPATCGPERLKNRSLSETRGCSEVKIDVPGQSDKQPRFIPLGDYFEFLFFFF